LKIGPLKAGKERKITAEELRCMRKTAANTWTGCKTTTEIAQEINIETILNKIWEYRTSCLQHVNRLPRNTG
jgi:hypothetical protein